MSQYFSVGVGREEYVFLRRRDFATLPQAEFYEIVSFMDARSILPRLVYSSAQEMSLRSVLPISSSYRDLSGPRLLDYVLNLLGSTAFFLVRRQVQGPWRVPAAPSVLSDVATNAPPKPEIFAVRARRVDGQWIGGQTRLYTSDRAERWINVKMDAQQHEGASPQIDLFSLCKQLKDIALGSKSPQ